MMGWTEEKLRKIIKSELQRLNDYLVNTKKINWEAVEDNLQSLLSDCKEVNCLRRGYRRKVEPSISEIIRARGHSP